jgi:hypothetical protein
VDLSMGESRDIFHRAFIPAVEIFAGEGMSMVEALRIETVCEMLRSVRLRSLVRYWEEKRRDRSMPARGEIDPTEIPHLLPIALMADSTPAGPRIRLLGSETTNAYGREIAGQLIDDVEFGEFTPSWRDAFARVRRSAGPASASGMFRASTETCSVEIVLTPLADHGTSLSHIFGGLVIRPVGRGVVRSNGTRAYISGSPAIRTFSAQTYAASSRDRPGNGR